jgi:sRNA-binding regulator protein Hfq
MDKLFNLQLNFLKLRKTHKKSLYIYIYDLRQKAGEIDSFLFIFLYNES